MAAEERRRAADGVIELSGDEEDEGRRPSAENESAAAARDGADAGVRAHVNKNGDRGHHEQKRKPFTNPLLDPPRCEPSPKKRRRLRLSRG